MSASVFRSPVATWLLGALARIGLRLAGWRIEGDIASVRNMSKAVVIGAPHTSNWDFPLMLAVAFVCGLEFHWMGKHTLFARPFGGLMRWLGGIAIDRRQANNTVAQMVQAFTGAEHMLVVIPPEGTRSRVSRWKTGFYHIARQAQVPIVLGFIDGGRRVVGFGPTFHPTGDAERDIAHIRAFYQDMIGIRPANS